MSKMQLWVGDTGEQAQGMPEVQDQAGCQEDEEELKTGIMLLLSMPYR